MQGTYAQQADAQQHAAATAAAHTAALAAATADAQQLQKQQQQHGGQLGEVNMTPGGGRTPIISISDAPVYHDAHGDAAAAAAAAAAHEHEQQVRAPLRLCGHRHCRRHVAHCAPAAGRPGTPVVVVNTRIHGLCDAQRTREGSSLSRFLCRMQRVCLALLAIHDLSNAVLFYQMQQEAGEGGRELPPEIRPRPRRRGSEVAASRKRGVQVRLCFPAPAPLASCSHLLSSQTHCMMAAARAAATPAGGRMAASGW